MHTNIFLFFSFSDCVGRYVEYERSEKKKRGNGNGDVRSDNGGISLSVLYILIGKSYGMGM